MLRLSLLLLLPLVATGQDALAPLPLRAVKVGGEIGRRIDVTIHNNLLVLDVEKDFLAPLETRDPKSGYIGLGKLLLSTVRFAAYSSDPRVLALKDRLVERILAAQGADGYLGYFSEKRRVSDLWDVHESGYLIAGLVDNFKFFGDKRSLAAAARAADYLITNWSRIPNNWTETAGVATHVGVTGIERTMLKLARATGEARYRAFVTGERALESWDFPIVVGRRAGIEGHIYAYMARSLAQLELHRTTPNPALLTNARRAVGFLEDEGMAVTGGAGQFEIWTADQDGRGHLGETCATAYQLRVYDSLLRLAGEARFGDLMERTIHNALFAAQSPDGRRIRYYAPFEGPREYHPVDTYCCPTNYRRIVAELPEMIYYRRGAGVAVNLYTASEAALKLAGTELKLRQETAYPRSGDVTIRVDPAAPILFPLALRIPAWAAGALVTVNGSPVKPAPGTFLTVARTWKSGDTVQLRFPMAPRLVLGRQRQAGRAAVLRGPVVYALNPAQNPELARLDAADLGHYTLDAASLATAPDGKSVIAKAWRPGYGTGAKPDLALTLTEFPDPDAAAVYFKLRDLRRAVPDELHRPARR